MTRSADPLVIFTPSGRRGHVREGTTVLDAARSLGVDIDSVCGGRGICGRCQVLVGVGAFPKHGITSSAESLSPFGEVEAAQGPVEVLVSNAGITDDQLLLRMSEESFRSVVDANLTAAFRVAKRASRGMLKARFGRLVFVSSVVGLSGQADAGGLTGVP